MSHTRLFIPDSGQSHQYIFIIGLHRSGTTLLANMIANHPQIGTFQQQPYPMNEGQFLQSVFALDTTLGGPGLFGFNPHAHWTEKQAIKCPAKARKLYQQWHQYWPTDQSIFLEKSPGNLLKTRYLQAIFPRSKFILIKRHPIITSCATLKWTNIPLSKLIQHWIHCHQVFDQDKQYLKHILEISYEEFIDHPQDIMKKIYDFAELKTAPLQKKNIIQSHDQRYIEQWQYYITSSQTKLDYAYIANQYQPIINHYPYQYDFFTHKIDTYDEQALSYKNRFFNHFAIIKIKLYNLLKISFKWRLKFYCHY